MEDRREILERKGRRWNIRDFKGNVFLKPLVVQSPWAITFYHFPKESRAGNNFPKTRSKSLVIHDGFKTNFPYQWLYPVNKLDKDKDKEKMEDFLVSYFWSFLLLWLSLGNKIATEILKEIECPMP